MTDRNQEDPRELVGPDATAGMPSDPEPALEDPAPLEAPAPPEVNTERGLIGWLASITVLGLVGLLFNQQELAGLVGCAGLFVAAQAADTEPRWRWLYLALAWIVPLSGAGAFIALGTLLQNTDLRDPWKAILIGYVGWAAFLSVILWIRRVADALVQVMFRGEPSSHTLRLTARLVLTGLLISIPAAFALRNELMEMLQSPDSPLTTGGFAGSLVGYVALALAGVGFLIRRTTAQTLERLGIRGLSMRDWAIAGVTVLVLVALTTGADFAQQRWFHDLWLKDQEMTRAMAAKLGLGSALLLGISAGVGEEVTMRGALQPKLGLILTSLLFASLHVQYTWFGVTLIFLLGVLLGVVRSRTHTGVVVVAHTAFDVVAVFTS